jgi:hypothetical protein
MEHRAHRQSEPRVFARMARTSAVLGIAVASVGCAQGGNEPSATSHPIPAEPITTTIVIPNEPTMTTVTTMVPIEATIATATAPTTAEQQPSTTHKILSLSSMNQSKDRVCNQRPPEWIAEWVGLAKGLGVSHIGLETPYDNPACNGDEHASDDYTKEWVDAIHAAGLSVWHRHMFTQFEGIYNAVRTPGQDWPAMIADYITTHPDLFQSGDIVTPMAEPFGGGVKGVTGCPDNICMFDSRKAYEASMIGAHEAVVNALNQLGKTGITVSGSNENGFTLFGAENPDHEGKRADSLVTDAMLAVGGLVVVDHGPPPGITMRRDLDILHRTFPEIDFMFGEWSPADATDSVALIHATLRTLIDDPHVVAVQYFQGGPTDSKYEGLFVEAGDHLVPNEKYGAVQEEFARAG